MADLTFNTTSGQTIERELMVAYLNTGSSGSPTWVPFGKRVTDSSIEYDWSEETIQDILGQTYTNLRKPTITQDFDPYDLDGGDTALVKIWNLAIKDQDYAALAAQDVLVVHMYAGTKNTAFYAERYDACAIRPTSIGGEGGGNVGMPISVTYGGVRTVGTAAKTSSGIAFSPAT